MLSPTVRTVAQSAGAALGSALLLSWLRIRPIGIFFLVLFIFWYYKTRCSFRIVPPPDLAAKSDVFLQQIRYWRENKPRMFCAISSGCFGALAVLGHLISSSVIVVMCLLVAALLSTKYNFKMVKIESKEYNWPEKYTHDTEVDDEFIPEVNERMLFVLERASDSATISSPIEDAEEEDEEDKSDEIPSELLIPDPIPEINENSSDDNDDDDLVPIVKNKTVSERNDNDKVGTNNKKSSAASSDVIEFKKGHFKRDSSLSTTSSSSEESLSKGLQFPDHTAIDGPALRQLPAPLQAATEQLAETAAIAVLSSSAELSHSQSTAGAGDAKTPAHTLLGNSTKLLPSLVTGIVQWSMGGSGGGSSSQLGTSTRQRVVTALDSSDDSDFEILETEDFK